MAARLQITPDLLLRFLLPGVNARVQSGSVEWDQGAPVISLLIDGPALPQGELQPVYDTSAGPMRPPQLVALSAEVITGVDGGG